MSHAPKPPCCGCESDSDQSRRGFLTKITIGLSGLMGAIIAAPAVGYIFAPFIHKREQTWRDVGPATKFVPGTTTIVEFEDSSPLPWAGITARSAAWVRRKETGELVAFSVNCTHLGCPVRWEAGSSLFMCPCHGGVYYADGEVAAGPPPKALPEYPVRQVADRVEVQTAPIPISTTTEFQV